MPSQRPPSFHTANTRRIVQDDQSIPKSSAAGVSSQFSKPTSPWPTSELRSSVKRTGEKDCGGGDMLRHSWNGDQSDSIPTQEQSITNLFGRSVEETLGLKLWSTGCGDEQEEPSGLVERPERDNTKLPFYLYPYESYTSSEHKGPMKSKPDDKSSFDSFQRSRVSVEVPMDVDAPSDQLMRHWSPQFSPIPELSMSDDTDEPSSLESSLSSLSSLPSPLPPISALFPSPFIKAREPVCSESLARHSELDLDFGRQLPSSRLRHCSPAEDAEGNVDGYGDADGTNSPSITSSGDNGTASDLSPKNKKKQPLHYCKQCNISFTRNFDLQRHNQRHNKVESQQDIARRTCTNCGRVLSRVDAARRHVETMPDSCNYIRKKESKPLLPVESTAYYEVLIIKYRKLADETKKPKGRKKAVVPHASA